LSNPIYRWNGRYFGFVSGDSLFDANGTYIGCIDGATVRKADGSYLGELKEGEYVLRSTSGAKPANVAPRGTPGTPGSPGR